MPHSSNKIDYNIEYVLLEKEIIQDKEKLIILLKKATKVLKEVPEPYRQILEFHYIDNLSIMEIYMLPQNNYSYETIKTYRKRGNKIYNEIYKQNFVPFCPPITML